MDWCRNEGEKHKTFFGENRFRKLKTSEFFASNLRTFEAEHWNFTLKKSDVFGFRTGERTSEVFLFTWKIPCQLK